MQIKADTKVYLGEVLFFILTELSNCDVLHILLHKLVQNSKQQQCPHSGGVVPRSTMQTSPMHSLPAQPALDGACHCTALSRVTHERGLQLFWVIFWGELCSKEAHFSTDIFDRYDNCDKPDTYDSTELTTN